MRESKERVFSALKNAGHTMPPARITVNLAPADIRKEGSGYDLPLALGLLAASEVLEPEDLDGWWFAGELSLTGDLRPVPGILPLAMRARQAGAKGVVVPAANAAEAAVVPDFDLPPKNWPTSRPPFPWPCTTSTACTGGGPWPPWTGSASPTASPTSARD